MTDAQTEMAGRIARQLADLSLPELKAMVVKTSAPILAELRRRGCRFSVGTDGIEDHHRPDASTAE